ncbi:MAG: hypothetical protein ACKVU1_07065 [bacterium]
MTTDVRREITEEEALMRAVARLNAGTLGVVAGAIAGGILFLATIVLVLKGGPNPGPHLALLGQYFIGYSVTVKGAFIGLFYAAILGYAVGYTIGKIYNKIVSLKNA